MQIIFPHMTNILRGIVPVASTWELGTIGYAFQDDGGVFTDLTTAANNATANDVSLYPTPGNNDAFYFGEGFSTSSPWNYLTINLGTAKNGVYTIVWEYYNGSAWVALTVVDGTNLFTTTGTKAVTFIEPSDWAAVAVNGQTRYWVRARISAFTSSVTVPLITQIWLGRVPTNLSSCTDGDLSTKTGTGTSVRTASGLYGTLIFDLGRTANYLLAGKVGMWTNTGSVRIYISCDDTTPPTSQVQNFLMVSVLTSEFITSWSGVFFGRYIKIDYWVSTAATAYANTYEILAWELPL